MKLSIVILSHNTKELLQECVKSVKSTIDNLSYEIIVVDNASNDNSSQMIKEKFKDVILFANKDNVGYSKGNNIGVKRAKGDFLLFLNADTLVYPKTIKTILEFMDQNKKAGAATCRVDLPNGELDKASHRGFPTPWRSFCQFSGFSLLFPESKFFNGYYLGLQNLDQIHEVEACAGAFMIVRREAGEEIGWWDEDFFWYGDDLDLCLRLREKGWKIYFVPTVGILHYKGVSGGIKKISRHLTSATKETRINATNSRFKAMKIFYNKHYKNKYPKFLTWLIMLAINLRWWFTLRSLR